MVNISTVCASSCVEYLRGAILDTPSRVCARSLCVLGCVCVWSISQVYNSITTGTHPTDNPRADPIRGGFETEWV